MNMTNVKLKTPIGDGVGQGRYSSFKPGTEERTESVVVRILITDAIRPHLARPYCMTPHAERSALFVFPLSEIGG
jgi:hypothetical protein